MDSTSPPEVFTEPMRFLVGQQGALKSCFIVSHLTDASRMELTQGCSHPLRLVQIIHLCALRHYQPLLLVEDSGVFAALASSVSKWMRERLPNLGTTSQEAR